VTAGLFADWSKWAVAQAEIVGSQKQFGTKLGQPPTIVS
jgi:hypothetical protein